MGINFARADVNACSSRVVSTAVVSSALVEAGALGFSHAPQSPVGSTKVIVQYSYSMQQHP